MRAVVRSFFFVFAFACAGTALAGPRHAPSDAAPSPSPSATAEPTASPTVAPHATRFYYIAAEEVFWRYMPGGGDGTTGKPPKGYAKFYASDDPDLIGPVYKKAVYREYTDGSFTHLKPRTGDDETLGLLGPIIRAEVGDTIVVVFRNRGTHPYSIHAHGVQFEAASEGLAPVPPGATFTYTWSVPEGAGPGPGDPSSIVWLYHSHADERRDTNAGLVGPIVITRAGAARADGSPSDVDHEFVALFMIDDENTSDFIDENVKLFVKDHSRRFNRYGSSPVDPDGRFDPLGGTGFVTANLRASINGFQFADGPAYRMKAGEHVRWYVLSAGEGLNVHSPHWQGNTVVSGGRRTDDLFVGSGSSQTVDMVPDNPGSWLLQCHVSEHAGNGMAARFIVSE